MKNEILIKQLKAINHQVIHFMNNEVLFHESEECQHVYLVMKGKIQIVTYSLNGEEEILSTINEGELFANALIFSDEPYFLGEVVGKENGELISFSKENIIFEMQKNTSFLTMYLQSISRKTITLNCKNKLLAHKNIRARMLYYFELSHGKIKKNVTMMSKELILPRPSVSRELRKLKDEGIIKEENGYLIFNK